MKKLSRQRIEVNVDELDRVLNQARRTPLNDDDYQFLKSALHAMAEHLRPAQRSEKSPPRFRNEAGGRTKVGPKQGLKCAQPA